VVGQTAVLTAYVIADSIVIAGEINGEVTAERIEMLSSARVRANVTTRVLVMHEGAVFEGHCSMLLDRPSAEEVAQQTIEQHKIEQREPASASISFFIAMRQRIGLRALGYDDVAIDKMKPAEAHKLLGLT
jgi:hypothetical protein